MSNQALAKRVWAVDAKGIVVDTRPAPPKRLSSGQRHYMYRLGLMAVDAFIKRKNFKNNTTFEGGSSKLSFEHNLGSTYVWIDVSLKEPENIAFVTSKPGYVYSANKVNAKVTTAKDIIGANMLIQLVVSTNDSGGTRNPVYIPLPPTLENPARYVFENVLGALADACEKIPAVKTAFSTKQTETYADAFQALEAEAAAALPPCV